MPQLFCLICRKHILYERFPEVKTLSMQFLLSEEAEQDSSSDRRADDSCHIRSHGVHQKVVVRVELPAYDFGDTRAVWHGGHSCVADQWIDLPVALEEQVPDLHEQHSAGCGDHE